MLMNTFLHIPYVGETTERELWKKNVMTWDDFLEKNIYVRNNRLIKKHLKLSKDKLEKKDHSFFARKLLKRYHWRAFHEFKDKCGYLDIETTGLDKQRDEITVIGLYDGQESKVFVQGKNLKDFKEEIKKYSMIVTFNGYCFDIPFIRNKIEDIEFNQFHVDLRFAMKYLGYSGGLKKIEKSLNIERNSDLNGMSGWDAVKLWYRYKKRKDEKALDTLIRYNIEDIENLKTLMEFSYEKLREKSFQL